MGRGNKRNWTFEMQFKRKILFSKPYNNFSQSVFHQPWNAKRHHEKAGREFFSKMWRCGLLKPWIGWQSCDTLRRSHAIKYGGGHGNLLQYSCLENPMTEKPGGLQLRHNCHRVGQHWSNWECARANIFNHGAICSQYSPKN